MYGTLAPKEDKLNTSIQDHHTLIKRGLSQGLLTCLLVPGQLQMYVPAYCVDEQTQS